ncbi:MAG: TetR family transcriptional regulator C-terminal domain-containing protein [Cytophagales bacterium]
MEKKDILKKYVEFALENGKEPSNMYQFAKLLNVEEKSLYECFTSLDSLESEVWKNTFETAISRLNADENYFNYSAKEKLLAFFFTWVEELAEIRSFVLMKKCKFDLPEEKSLKESKEVFLDYISDVLRLGKETKEISDRMWISNNYGNALWLEVLFILRFWINDKSPKFEKTDAAIEKAVNFSFELMGSNILDAALDLGKFVWANK